MIHRTQEVTISKLIFWNKTKFISSRRLIVLEYIYDYRPASTSAAATDERREREEITGRLPWETRPQGAENERGKERTASAEDGTEKERGPKEKE